MSEFMLAEAGWGFLIFVGIVIISAIFDSLKKQASGQKKGAKPQRSPQQTAGGIPPSRSQRQTGPTSSPRAAGPASRPASEPTSPAEALRRLMEDLSAGPREAPPEPTPPVAARRQEEERNRRLQEMERMARQRRIESQAEAPRPNQPRLTRQQQEALQRHKTQRKAPTSLKLETLKPRTSVETRLGHLDTARLQEAFLMSEILQPPLAMRGTPGGHRPR